MKRIIIPLLFIFLFSPSIIYPSSVKEDKKLQERCGKSCEEWIKNQYRSGFFIDRKSKETSSYSIHYNNKLKICFVVLTISSSVKNQTNTYKVLLDVNQGKEFGKYLSISDNKTPINCFVTEKSCKSEKEWDSLVKPFMEE
jgi:hypothetical protein